MIDNSLILSILIFCPLLGALIVAFLPRSLSRPAAAVVAAITFLLSLHLWAHWGEAMGANGFQFEQSVPWLPNFGVKYHLGVDGLSVFLIILTTFLTPLVILSGWGEVSKRTKEFVICLLLLESAVMGVFSALDVILYYIFWEAVLIPTALLIGGWGGPRRVYAAMKFFIYTMAGSVLMWVAMIYIYLKQPAASRSFDFVDIRNAAQMIQSQEPHAAMLLFAAFAIAFAIKVPIFPLHTWSPDAYTEAPSSVSVMLAAVLSKMGAYGFLRFAIPFFPVAARNAAPLMMTLAIISIIYGAMVAIMQTDIKRLLAYSSMSHLGFIILGIFAAVLAAGSADSHVQPLSQVALSGAALQMVSHGISTGALFMLAGVLDERRRTHDIGAFGGLAKVMPHYTILFWIAMFASIGLPGLSGFVGEYLILQGTMATSFWYAAAGATGVILGAVYMLRMFRSVMFGEVTHDENKDLRDVNQREMLVLGAVLAVAVWMGVMPQPFLSIINGSTQNMAGALQSGTPGASPQAALPETGRRG